MLSQLTFGIRCAFKGGFLSAVVSFCSSTCSCRQGELTKNWTRVEWYNPAFFKCTGDIIDSIGQGPCLLVDWEEVSVDSNICGKEVVLYCLAVVGLKLRK